MSRKDEHVVEQIGLIENKDAKTNTDNQNSKSNIQLNITNKNYLDPNECKQNDNGPLTLKI